MRLILPTLCVFLIIARSSSGSRVRKCCPQGFSVDGTDPTFPMCREGTGPDYNTGQRRPPSPHFPNCKKDFEIHSRITLTLNTQLCLSFIEGSNSSLEYDVRGNLITSRYGPKSPIRDFCVDYLVNTTEVVTVTCDLCKARKVETED